MKFNYEVLADDSAKLTSIEEPEEEIVIPEELDGHKVSEIGSNVIPEGKSDVKSITLPQSVTTLDSEAFADHHYLKTLKLNQGLKAIGERAIYTCPDLAELYVPMSVTGFGAHCIGFMANNKHLSLSDRTTIETQLDKRTSFKLIALALDKDPSTISKEIRAHFTVERVGGFHRRYNPCVSRMTCLVSGLCTPCNAGRNYRRCRDCGMCSRFCPDFEKYSCPRLAKPPYVCNGCPKRPDCTLEKHFYSASAAYQEYQDNISEPHTGISYSEDDLKHFDSVIAPLLKQGQSLHHICAANEDTLMVSERTIYRLIDGSMLSVNNLDLPRKVRFRPRKKKRTLKLDRKCRIGREYSAFLEFMSVAFQTSTFSTLSAIVCSLRSTALGSPP